MNSVLSPGSVSRARLANSTPLIIGITTSVTSRSAGWAAHTRNACSASYAQHVLEMFRRSLDEGSARRLLDRLANRLVKILAETRKLNPPQE